MNQTYQDDPNRQVVLPPYQPVQTMPSNNTFMDYVRNNKLTVAIVIIILIGLIWWFCMRKQNNTNINLPVMNPADRINITRTKN